MIENMIQLCLNKRETNFAPGAATIVECMRLYINDTSFKNDNVSHYCNCKTVPRSCVSSCLKKAILPSSSVLDWYPYFA